MQDINKLKQYASQWIVENKQTFHAVADEIWSNPELGLEEFHASALLTSVLEKHGFLITRGQ